MIEFSERAPRAFLALLAVVGLALDGSARAATMIGCDDLEVDSSVPAAEVYAYGSAEVDVVLKNVGSEAIRIKAVNPRRPPGRAVVSSHDVKPSETTTIRTVKPVADKLGLIGYGFAVVLEAKPNSRVCMMRVPVFTQSAYRPEVPGLDVEDVEEGKRFSAHLDVTTHDAAALRVLSVEGLPEWIEHRIVATDDPQTSRIQMEITERATRGGYSGALRIKTDLAIQPWVQGRISVKVFGKIVPSEARLDFAGVMQGESKTRVLELRHRDGAAFALKGVTSGDDRITLSEAACGNGCVALTVGVDTARLGPINTVVQVDLEGELGTLLIPVTALVTTADNPVIDLGNPDEAPKQIRREGGKP